MASSPRDTSPLLSPSPPPRSLALYFLRSRAISLALFCSVFPSAHLHTLSLCIAPFLARFFPCCLVRFLSRCCSVLQCIAACCSALQRVEACCIVLQGVSLALSLELSLSRFRICALSLFRLLALSYVRSFASIL